jgi:hypothetical protein
MFSWQDSSQNDHNIKITPALMPLIKCIGVSTNFWKYSVFGGHHVGKSHGPREMKIKLHPG